MPRNYEQGANSSLFADVRSPYLIWLLWVIWLPFGIPSLVYLFQSQPSLPHLIVVLTEVGTFFTLYLWATWRTAQRLVDAARTTKRTEVSIWSIAVIMTALSFALTLAGPTYQWLFPCIFTSGYVGGSLRPARAIPAVIILTGIIVIFSILVRLNWLDLLQVGVFVLAVGGIVMGVVRAIKTSWELRAAREEIAHLAMVAERLRIARDLHDLLGHNLSLITLKSELAGRLVHAMPEKAALEIRDVEQVARTTLQEVREAVASYRQPTLLNELRGAQDILAAAGIAYHYEEATQHKGPLHTDVEVVLAWTVREGVTNIIRHSHAQHCSIFLQRGKRATSIVIINDQRERAQRSDNPEPTTILQKSKGGNGLRGLAERVAALDGQLDVGPHAETGFRLAVSIPLKRRAAEGKTVTSSMHHHMPATVPEHESQ